MYIEYYEYLQVYAIAFTFSRIAQDLMFYLELRWMMNKTTMSEWKVWEQWTS